MRFAQVSGDVVVATGDDASVNLVLVAPADDPVWSGIHELVVTNESPDDGDIILAGDSAELIPGTSRNGLQVGTIPVTIPNDASEFELKSVKVSVGDGGNSTSYDIGDWKTIRVDPDHPTVKIVGDYPASMPGSGQVAFNVQREDGSGAEITGIDTNAPGLSIGDFSAEFDSDGVGQVAFNLESDGSYDVFGFSPKLLVEDGGETHEISLDPILVGYLDMSEEDVQRIVSR